METSKERHEYMLMLRGIEDPCKACSGSGVKAYSNTTTWAGGIGGQMITSDICDKCWGTGDAYRKGVNLRVLRIILTKEQMKQLREKS